MAVVQYISVLLALISVQAKLKLWPYSDGLEVDLQRLNQEELEAPLVKKGVSKIEVLLRKFRLSFVLVCVLFHFLRKKTTRLHERGRCRGTSAVPVCL